MWSGTTSGTQFSRAPPPSHRPTFRDVACARIASAIAPTSCLCISCAPLASATAPALPLKKKTRWSGDTNVDISIVMPVGALVACDSATQVRTSLRLRTCSCSRPTALPSASRASLGFRLPKGRLWCSCTCLERFVPSGRGCIGCAASLGALSKVLIDPAWPSLSHSLRGNIEPPLFCLRLTWHATRRRTPCFTCAGEARVLVSSSFFVPALRVFQHV